jgi:hypothetical protein
MAEARAAGMSKPQILRIVDREPTEADIRWLQRRLKQGRESARDAPWSVFFEAVRALPQKKRSEYLTAAIRRHRETDQPVR